MNVSVWRNDVVMNKNENEKMQKFYKEVRSASGTPIAPAFE